MLDPPRTPTSSVCSNVVEAISLALVGSASDAVAGPVISYQFTRVEPVLDDGVFAC